MSTPGVLFLCVHNAGRSQMAAGWLRHLDWPLDDPAGKDLEFVRRVRDEIRTRVESLLSELTSS